jgi:hypothetical protein
MNIQLLNEARAKWDAAGAKYEQDRQALYRQDGAPLYSESEMKDRLAPLTNDLNIAHGNVLLAAATALDHAEGLAHVQFEDELLDLLPEDQARAAVLRDLVADYCANAPLDKLARRVEATARTSDLVVRTLYARYARFRVTKEEDELAARQSISTLDDVPQFDNRAVLPLAQAVNRLAATLDRPRVAQSMKEAAALRDGAWSLRREVAARYEHLTGAGEREQNARRQEIRDQF